MKEDDPTKSLFYKMQDGSVIREYNMVSNYYVTDETERRFEIVFPGETEPMPFYLCKHETTTLSSDLSFIGTEVTRLAGTTVGRYILPVEDFYILVTGKDFDGDESSRIAAGGFIILEVVQVGKVFKLAKGAKILTATGGAISASRRVAKQFATEVSKDAAIDIFAQFTVNFMIESIENQ